MATSVEKATIYESFLDSVVQAGLTSQDLIANPYNIRYNGGNTVSIATISTTGMTNYDRNAGYTRGSGNLVWEDYVIPYDRGFEFLIDAMDTDESNAVFTAGNVLKEFGDNEEVPELDTIRYAAIFQAIVDDSVVRYGYYAPVAATLLTQFNNDVAIIRKSAGRSPILKAKMAESAFAVLTNSTELAKQMQVQSVSGDNGVTTEIYKINGVQIIPVPDARMKTEAKVVAAGDGGYTIPAWAMDINWLIYSADAVVGFEKHRKVKVFGNGTHTEGDGDLIQGRLYHGCWVLANKHNMIYASLKIATIAGFSADELKTTGATNITYTIANIATKDTGHKFYYLTTATLAAVTVPAAYDDFVATAYTEITTADAVAKTVTSGYFGALAEIDENGRVIRFETIQASA